MIIYLQQQQTTNILDDVKHLYFPLITDSGDEDAQACATDDPGHNEDRSRNQTL